MEPLVTGLNFKARRATVSSSCLATQPRPHYVHFNTNTTAVLDSEHNIQAMGGIVLVTEQSGALSLVGIVEIVLSLVETFIEMKYFHNDATPALLCHKEPALASKAPY